MDCDILDWSPIDSDYIPTQIVQIRIDNVTNNEQLLDTELDERDQEFINRNYSNK